MLSVGNKKGVFICICNIIDIVTYHCLQSCSEMFWRMGTFWRSGNISKELKSRLVENTGPNLVGSFNIFQHVSSFKRVLLSFHESVTDDLNISNSTSISLNKALVKSDMDSSHLLYSFFKRLPQK